MLVFVSSRLFLVFGFRLNYRVVVLIVLFVCWLAGSLIGMFVEVSGDGNACLLLDFGLIV